MAESTPVATHQRVRRRGALRARADLADLARHLRADRPGVVLHHRRARTRRRTSSAASARSSPSCRSSCFGYAAYLIPAVIAWAGWHYFWCQPLEAVYTKLFGVDAALRLQQRIPQPRLRQHRRRRARRSTPAARSAAGSGALVRGIPQPHRLDHRHPDADGAVGHPVDAVLVRPDVRQRQPGIARSVGARRRLPPRAGSTTGASRSSAAR